MNITNYTCAVQEIAQTTLDIAQVADLGGISHFLIMNIPCNVCVNNNYCLVRTKNV